MTKRKSHKTVKHRRKKMGAIKQDGSLEALAGAALGYIGAYITEQSIQSLSASALAAIQVLAGGALAYFPKNWFIKGVGVGVFVNGAGTAAESYGLISGIMGSAYDPSRGINGAAQIRRIGDANAFPKPNAVGNSTNAKMTRMYGACYK